MQSTFWKRTICSVLACSSLFYSLPLSSAADAETGASASETESTEPTEPPDDPVVSSTDAPAETTETATETILEEPDDDNISLGDLTGDGMIAVDDAVFVDDICKDGSRNRSESDTESIFLFRLQSRWKSGCYRCGFDSGILCKTGSGCNRAFFFGLH